jgi:outer membrane receptor protein involved in Fe transport
MIRLQFSRTLSAVLVTLVLAVAPRAGAQQATTSGTVRGIVSGTDGAPLGDATVTATNQASGVRRGIQSDANGRYQLPFLEPGTYTIRAQRIGLRPVERPDLRIALGEVLTQDFRLESAPVQLSAQIVRADVAPLIEQTKTGTNTRILEEQIRNLPTSDRNFKNLVVLTPGSSDVGATGAGGGQSIGGGRTASSNLLMDGVNNNESYFGGDARGGDRLPFSYSIEAVKEIQVITAGYDVERGQFTGGTVNAVTKSGTNLFHGSVFDYERGDKRFGVKLTGDDFLGRKPRSYLRRQSGASFGGPILKDRLHFFLALDRQIGNEPKPVLQTSASPAAIRAAGINPDTLARLLNIASTVYGYDLSKETGALKQNIDETAVFGRLDWAVNDRHTLTFRDNFLNFRQTQDRLTIAPSTNETISNAGPYKEKTNSGVLALSSVLSNRLSNELRVQYATDRKPRPSNPSLLGGPIPQITINGIVSPTGDGSNVTTAVIFGSDPVLHANNLEQNTAELIDNVRYTLNAHTLKFGVNALRVHVFNDFFFNALGTYTFNNLTDFAARNPARFTRALPFVPGGANPDALFNVYEYAAYVQDEFQATPKLFLTYGLRYDNSRFPTKPTANPTLKSGPLGLNTDYQPSGKGYLSPRFGFTFDPNADGRQLIRGGSGLFYGRSPYVLYGNTLSNTGLTQRDLNCPGSTPTTPTQVPTIDLPGFAQNPANIPTVCAGGAGAAPSRASPVIFSHDFEQTRAWKSNLAYDRLLTPSWRLTLEGVYTRIAHDYVVQDANLNTTQQFTIEGGIPVYVPASTIPTAGTAAGSTNISNSRRDANFNNVFVQTSLGEAKSVQGIVQIRGSMAWASVLASYTYDHTRDYNSSSCCIAGGDLFNSTRAFGNPNALSGQYGPASYSRPQSIILSPTLDLPWGFLLSGIYRGYSGLPWSPRYRGDVNGDGVANDRLYIPTDAELAQYRFIGADSVAQRAAFNQKITSTPCLNDNRGRVVGRNSCRNPWQNIVDMRVAKTFNTVRGQSAELSVDFFNLLNGLKSSWGQRNEVQATNEQALQPRGFVAGTTNRFAYQYNTNFAKQEPSAFGLSQQFQMQLGIRYAF